MLKIKHAYHLHIPRIDLVPKRLALSPVPSEDDPLIQAIDNSYIEKDDNWTLSNTPDVQELEGFWGRVQEDLSNDPEWFKFDDQD